MERFKHFHLKLCPLGGGGSTKKNSGHLSKLNLALYNERENSNTRGEALTSTLQRGNGAAQGRPGTFQAGPLQPLC